MTDESLLADAGSKVALKRVANAPGSLFTDGDWIESPYIQHDGVRLLQTGNVGVGRFKEQGFRYVSEKTFYELRCTEVLPGDLLICRLAEPVGRACLVPDLGVRMITSVDNCIVRPNSEQWSARYLNYALSGEEYLQGLEAMARGGTRDRVSRSMLGDVQITRPQLELQERIANYLDDKTARIDALIAEKERLSEVLQESLEACVERAILAPSLSAKTSRVKHVVSSISTGPFGSALHASEYVEGGIPVINPAHIIQGEVVPDPAVSVDAATANRLSSYSLSAGDLVVGRRGEMGRCAVIRADGAGWLCGTGSLVVRPDTGLVLADYLQLVISSRAARDWLSLESVGSTMENLNEQILLRLPGYFPSLVEQAQRLKALRRSKAHHDALMAHVKEHLARLREYRSSLISAAVTGQLDLGSFEAAKA